MFTKMLSSNVGVWEVIRVGRVIMGKKHIQVQAIKEFASVWWCWKLIKFKLKSPIIKHILFSLEIFANRSLCFDTNNKVTNSLIRWPVNNTADNIFPTGSWYFNNNYSTTSISSKLKSARILKSRLSEIYNSTPPPLLFGRCLWIKLKPCNNRLAKSQKCQLKRT